MESARRAAKLLTDPIAFGRLHDNPECDTTQAPYLVKGVLFLNTEPSTFEHKESNMELTASKDIVSKLKAVKTEYELSLPKIKEMVESNGDYISLTTLRRVFSDNSEEDSFSYDRTIAPIAKALLFQDGEETLQEDIAEGKASKRELLLATIDRKNEKIELLERENAQLREQINIIRAEYDRRLAFLRDQIELKDKRMDQKDVIIEKLMEKCL